MADFFALFCTAPQSASYINKLLKHADENTFDAGNVFCLIESPEQKRVDKPTAPEVADFGTGFAGWSVKGLGDFCKEKFKTDNPKSQPPYISATIFAVLDERTTKDGTVLLAAYDYWTERINPDDPSDADDAFRDCEGYRQLRAKWKAAPDLIHTMPEIDLSQVVDSVKPEDDGVWLSLIHI